MKIFYRYILVILIFSSNFLYINGEYYLYDDDCLDYNVTNDAQLLTGYTVNEQQFVPFCRNDNFEDDQDDMSDREISKLTFDQLSKRDISSLQLFEWSVHLDLVEEYQFFLENRTDKKMISSNFFIYNCSIKLKFGQHCQYSFNSHASFDTIVKNIFKTYIDIPSNGIGTCYIHLNCKRNDMIWCLDWREVCDGKADCWPNHVDEYFCEKLEQNDCAPNEYRCFNGQCIPDVFLLDRTAVPDCLDSTDEEANIVQPFSSICDNNNRNPSFRCSDVSCRHWTESISQYGRELCEPMKCRTKLEEQINRNILLPIFNGHITKNCWITMICLLKMQYLFLNDSNYAHLFNDSCKSICFEPRNSCTERIIKYCWPLFEFPASSIGWSDLHFVYGWNRTKHICYNEQRCSTSQTNFRFKKISDPSIILSCESSSIDNPTNGWLRQVRSSQRHTYGQCSFAIDVNDNFCSEKTQFRCGRKCISKYRIGDRRFDCSDLSDEILYKDTCNLNLKYRVRCKSDDPDSKGIVCIPSISISTMGENNCGQNGKLPHFPTLCNGYVEHTEYRNQRTETDEDNCEAWLCDNQYTRCNGIWNCPNGEDENNCFHEICNGSIGQPCLLLYTAQFICLPAANISDGIVDCIGATDEQQACRNILNGQTGYRCLTDRSDNKQFSNETRICTDGLQACFESSICRIDEINWSPLCADEYYWYFQCAYFWKSDRRLTKDNIMCSLDDDAIFNPNGNYHRPEFSLDEYNVVLFTDSIDGLLPIISKSEFTSLLNLNNQEKSLIQFQCYGGIPIYLRNQIKCLCPPYLYGSQCQYQNQRVSITLQISAPEWRIPFIFIIYLIDETYDIINSYYQIRYLSIRDCNTKFNFHLIYLTKPKFINRTYSIRIDVFEMNSLKYRASWFYPILFPILPVYRLPIHLTVPLVSLSPKRSCRRKCSIDRGECISYTNTGEFFCRCKPNWTGSMCTIPYQCNCSPDSICVGIWKNKSICVCPTYKFGRRCYLKNNLCKRSNAEKCRNRGQCIPGNMKFPESSSTFCSCPYGFHGDLCELTDTRIDISILLPPIQDFLLIHFITINSHMNSNPYIPILKYGPHERATTFKKIPFDKNIVSIYWQYPFHMIFIEYNYYLYMIFNQTNYNRISYLKVNLQSHHQCRTIREFFNQTIMNYSLLRRVKYYHLPCQNDFDLNCFHDEEDYICLCTFDRRANCFTFDHKIKFSCQQLSYCQNGGQCFQNNLKCPSAALCSCPKCYLGTRCQISTRGFNLPLDVILGYRIRPGYSFSNQPISLQLSGIITLIMFIFGLIQGSFSCITFQEKELQKFGIGIYLFTAAILSIVTISIFTLKYILFLITQILMMTNRQFLFAQCIIIDFLLKISVQIGDWLYACVAIERLLTVIKDINFNRKQSRKIAKWIIFIVCLIIIINSIHEPFYRRLVYDEDERRTWCILQQTKSLDLLTSISTVFHILCPFIINIISALGILLMRIKHRLHLDKHRRIYHHIHNQFHKHKYLIISPIGLILLVSPRIILAFQLECMKSARESITLFLIGYFISFLPCLSFFIIFILPSEKYRQAFKIAIHTRWNTFYRRIRCQ
ncbi:hypothetical protein I4U23_022549 [Adineta vaga]|nr:hypothetical protein I4U23_022549 [Adineta vaga]